MKEIACRDGLVGTVLTNTNRSNSHNAIRTDDYGSQRRNIVLLAYRLQKRADLFNARCRAGPGFTARSILRYRRPADKVPAYKRDK